jgi:iron complex outermembrane receptor protein
VRVLTICCLASLFGAGVAGTAMAAPFQQSVSESAIPAMPLNKALNAFSQREHLQLVYVSKITDGVRTHGAPAGLTLQATLQKLLEGTGLKFRFLNAKTVTIYTQSEAPDSEGGIYQKNMLVEKGSKDNPEQLQQVMVTGSRIPLTASQQSIPVHVYTSEDIERSGQATVVDFLNTLPQVSVPSVPGNLQSFASNRSVSLHGLPVGSTLVLIDGQRTEISRYGYMDLSVIPTSAIDRVEIIPVGASAIYGSDALAGVVNIILKKNFDGFEANSQFGYAKGAGNQSINIAAGREWDKGGISFIGNYQYQGELAAYQRKLPSMGDYENLGGRDWRVDYCNPGNVYALNGNLLPGLGASSAGIPYGIKGVAKISDFKETAGKVNKCSIFKNYAVIPSFKQYGALLSGHYNLTSSLELYAAIMYSHYHTDIYETGLINLSGGSLGNYVLSASNPYNPFKQDVGVSWSYGVLDLARDTDFYRPVVGIRGDLVGDWRWEVTGLYAHEKSRVLEQTVNSGGVRAALGASDPADAINIFTSESSGAHKLLNSLYYDHYDLYNDSLLSWQAIARGSLFSLPAGRVQAAFGGSLDHLREWDLAADGLADAISDRKRSEYAFFTEERIPIIGDGEASGKSDILALSLAARYDHSDDFGGKGTYQGGLEWRPTSGLLLRAAYGTSYRAPQLPEIYQTPHAYSGSVVDPMRDGQSYAINVVYGPNTSLKPETGISKSLGLVYSPRDHFRGFESSLTWWSINYSNYIGMLNIQDAVNNPGRYPDGVVVRGEPTSSDVANGWPGEIQYVNGIYVNFGWLRLSGVDLDASYRIPSRAGMWTPSISLTETYKYEVNLNPGQDPYSVVSKANTAPGYAPRWKGSVAMDWQRGAFEANVKVRYISSYADYSAYAPAGYKIGNYWLFDANLNIQIGRYFKPQDVLHGLYASIGVVNAFDRSPQFSYYPYIGYDFQQGDIRGRYVYAQIGLRL